MRVPVILVVDDEALLRMLATDYFEEAGYEVVQAANGRDALAVLAARPEIRAVVTDVQMPGTPDGLELAGRVRDLSPSCAIVVVSGRVPPSAINHVPGARFLPKPYRGEEVVELVQEMIGPA